MNTTQITFTWHLKYKKRVIIHLIYLKGFIRVICVVTIFRIITLNYIIQAKRVINLFSYPFIMKKADIKVNIWLSILLWYFWVDRFYQKNYILGLLKLFTFWGYWIWWLVDIFILVIKHPEEWKEIIKKFKIPAFILIWIIAFLVILLITSPYKKIDVEFSPNIWTWATTLDNIKIIWVAQDIKKVKINWKEVNLEWNKFSHSYDLLIWENKINIYWDDSLLYEKTIKRITEEELEKIKEKKKQEEEYQKLQEEIKIQKEEHDKKLVEEKMKMDFLQKNRLAEVCTYSQAQIKENLISPKSAEFQSCYYWKYMITTKSHIFESYVDSQNSFWVMIRNKFRCFVTYEYPYSEPKKVECETL